MADKEAPRIPTSTGKKSTQPDTRGNKDGSLTGSVRPREEGSKTPPSGGKKK